MKEPGFEPVEQENSRFIMKALKMWKERAELAERKLKVINQLSWLTQSTNQDLK